MIMRFVLVTTTVLALLSCNSDRNYPLSEYGRDYDGMLDTLLPFIAGYNDTLPPKDSITRQKLMAHKLDRQYEWMHYAEKGNTAYFMVSRLESSLRKDKYAAVCGKFTRDSQGKVDLSSYEELFWTWKMKKDSLSYKGDILFSIAVENGKLDAYLPEKSAGYWIEFPSSNVYYDKAGKAWKTKLSIE